MPEPQGGRRVGDHRGHLLPEGSAANPKDVNIRPNVVSERPSSNLGPKKSIDNTIARESADPAAQVESVHDPIYIGTDTVPVGVTHWVIKDGKLVRAQSTLNR